MKKNIFEKKSEFKCDRILKRNSCAIQINHIIDLVFETHLALPMLCRNMSHDYFMDQEEL